MITRLGLYHIGDMSIDRESNGKRSERDSGSDSDEFFKARIAGKNKKPFKVQPCVFVTKSPDRTADRNDLTNENAAQEAKIAAQEAKIAAQEAKIVAQEAKIADLTNENAAQQATMKNIAYLQSKCI